MRRNSKNTTQMLARRSPLGAAVLACAALGCGGDGGGSGIDARIGPDADSRCVGFASPLIDGCAIVAPGSALVLDEPGRYIYDTDTGTLTDPDGATSQPTSELFGRDIPARVISVDSLVIAQESELRAVGSAPLVIAVWGDVEIEGEIDVSSRFSQSGAGANPAVCDGAGAVVGEPSVEGAGGGGGGAFAAGGGDGGDGEGSGQFARGGAGGASIRMPGATRGGCPGAAGGEGEDPGGAGAGGAGGGGLHIVALGAVDIDGELLAGGAGGRGADGDVGPRAGGGGGGSGGLIAISASALVLGDDAHLAANGGGGGGGTNFSPSEDGENGNEFYDDAEGGFGGGGGDGGDGGYGDAPLGEPGDGDSRGGGGGGGGGGFVILHATSLALDSDASLSPDPFLL